MGKQEWKKSVSIIDEHDDNEKEIILRELGESVQKYLKTGVKNNQLERLLIYEKAVQEKYKEHVDINIVQIVDKITEVSKKNLLEKNHLKIEVQKWDENQKYEMIFQETVDDFTKIATEILEDKLHRILKDVAYLGHINMLYEIYEKEETLRREEQQFEKISRNYQKLADIAKELGEQRRMEIENLEKKANVSKQELQEILNGCSKYFNVHPKKNTMQISLTPSGKRYNEYLLKTKENKVDEIVNQYVYKNCNNIMESFENSISLEREFELELDGITPDKKRSIMHKYYNILKKIMSDNEYCYDNIKLKNEKESEKRTYEPYEYRVIEEWYEEEY